MGMRSSFTLRRLNAEILADMLFANTREPVIKITPNGVEAASMSKDKNTLYELMITPKYFEEYDVSETVLIELYSKGLLRNALKPLRLIDEAEFELTSTGLIVKDTVLGRYVEKRQEIPPIKLELTNTIEVYPLEFKNWIRRAVKAETKALGIAYNENNRQLYIEAWGDDARLVYKKPTRFTGTGRPFASAYNINLINTMTPDMLWDYASIFDAKIMMMDGFEKPMAIEVSSEGWLTYRVYIAPVTEYSEEFAREKNIYANKHGEML